MQEFLNRASSYESVAKHDARQSGYRRSRTELDKDLFNHKKEDNLSPVHEKSSIIAS